VSAILSSPEAKGREAQALVFALDTDMAPDVAAKALAASPVAQARPPLEQRPNPPVPGGHAPTGRPSRADNASAWDRSLARAGAKLPS